MPTSISMHRAEVCSVVPPESYFVSIPRFARITAFHDWFENGEMREYFQHFRWVKSGGDDENANTNREENHDDKSSATTTTITTHNTVWFETKPMEVELFNLRGGKKRKISIPIQWNAPFGVIADIIKALVGSENNTVPLELVARYSQRDELSLSFRHALGDDAQKACKSHFFNALKEASYIQTGSSQVVMSMGVQVRENLWESTMTMGTVISGDEDIDSNSTGYKKAKEALTKIRKEAGKRKIVCKAPDLVSLKGIFSKAKKAGLVCHLVTDAGHTEIPPGTETVVGIGPGPRDQIDKITGQLSLVS